MIKFVLRNGSINMPLKIYESIYSFEWFISKLIKYEVENTKLENNGKDKDKDKDNIIIELWEDKEIILSIFDSIKFNSLIIYDDVNIDYLYELANYYNIPEHILTLLEEKKNKIESESLELKKIKENIILDETIYECNICGIGFKKSENKNDSCKTHKYGYNFNEGKFVCCARPIEDENFCRIGYHIPKFRQMNS